MIRQSWRHEHDLPHGVNAVISIAQYYNVSVKLMTAVRWRADQSYLADAVFVGKCVEGAGRQPRAVLPALNEDAQRVRRRSRGSMYSRLQKDANRHGWSSDAHIFEKLLPDYWPHLLPASSAQSHSLRGKSADRARAEWRGATQCN
jgi:hypothetical protein